MFLYQLYIPYVSMILPYWPWYPQAEYFDNATGAKGVAMYSVIVGLLTIS